MSALPRATLPPSAEQAPWAQAFLPLLRRVAALRSDLPGVGEALRPSAEAFRIGQTASLSFAPREIAALQEQAGKLMLTLYGLGMLGPQGPLPLHMTDQVRERVDTKRDHTLNHFLDLFHHRALSHFYRAWAQSQAAAGLDRASEESFSNYVARLCGDEPELAQGLALPTHARWATTAHRVRQARNPDGLAAAVAQFFGISVKLQEHCLQWMRLAPEDESHMGSPGPASVMGQGAVAGEAIPDRQSRFRLVLGPLTLEQYLRFTPEGHRGARDLPALVELVRAFIGFEYAWEVELLVHRHSAPPCHLGDAQQLGWSTWMGTPDAAHSAPISGMVFEPEHSLPPAHAPSSP
ncbi:type VI secretion system baseplate subunit TssG [Roseateles sp. BYS180W]|uniref:Type VI secretion system baseplate subunit TssG n=1 Tax=Roseateles rivi TaxID=3299028 RepID=A0ABW7FSZ0_9BURK